MSPEPSTDNLRRAAGLRPPAHDVPASRDHPRLQQPHEPASGWPEQVHLRARQLVADGEYPNQAQAFPVAIREFSDGQRRLVEDQVLAASDRLDPADTSTEARLVRETAASIGDHRSDAARRQPSPLPPGDTARLAAISFALPAASVVAGPAAAATPSHTGPPTAAAASAATHTKDATSRRRSR